MSENQRYLEFAKSVAYEAGETMRKYFLHTEREWKEDQTPLTIADTTINQMVIDRIVEQFPEHSVLGEEQSIMKENSRFTWVCDPVDGTMPYSHGLPISTFSLALCDDGRPILGVVYDPFMNRLFWAQQGGGAFCNDRKIQVNQNGFSNALIDLAAVERSFLLFKKDMVVELFALGAKSTRLWSSILPTALIAAGEYTASIFGVRKPEDGAAIKIIVEEAGGKVTDLFGDDQRYDRPTKGFIASNGVIHDELVKLIQEATT